LFSRDHIEKDENDNLGTHSKIRVYPQIIKITQIKKERYKIYEFLHSVKRKKHIKI